jgi:hypothetical protein
MTFALCATAIILAIWLIARKRRALTGGRVRAHVPGSDSRGSAGGSRHDSSDGVDTALVVLALTDNDSSGHHGGGDHHGCSTAHSCSGSHGCGGGDGGASGGD